MEEWEQKWELLTFHGFDQEEYARKHVAWKNAAREVIGFLKNNVSVGVVADTAAGKTIIAILAIIATGKRTLFLTPQRLLTGQHHELLAKMDGQHFKSRSINGQTPKKKRVWSKPEESIVFATPHVVAKAIAQGSFAIRDFQLVIFDEMHRATGNYPYVPIAKFARENALLAMGLTASPGGTMAKIETVKKNLFLGEIIQLKVETPRKNEDIVIVAPDEKLLEIEKIFRAILLNVSQKISQLGIKIDLDKPVNMRVFEGIEKILHRDHDRTGHFLAALYRKIYHAYFTAITDGYQPMLKYLSKLKQQDKTWSAKAIVQDARILKLAWIAKKNQHPKVEKFYELLASLKNAGKNALIFFRQKETAKLLVNPLTAVSWKAEILFGGEDKNIKRQYKTLQKLVNREIDFIFATSVAEEGLSVPEIDTVIHYSMPQTEISRIQRGGRTGRMQVGHIIFLMIDHPFDKTFYYVSKRQTRNMHKIIKDCLAKESAEPAPMLQPSKKKRNKKRCEFTLPLFPD